MANMSKEERKVVNELVFLYFQHNPEKNKGMGWRIKANDIIRAYYITHKKTKEEIAQCIESQPQCILPIWTQFENFFNKKKVEKSEYKNSINDSTDVNDWL
jgi:hypothetical protein